MVNRYRFDRGVYKWIDTDTNKPIDLGNQDVWNEIVKQEGTRIQNEREEYLTYFRKQYASEKRQGVKRLIEGVWKESYVTTPKVATIICGKIFYLKKYGIANCVYYLFAVNDCKYMYAVEKELVNLRALGIKEQSLKEILSKYIDDEFKSELFSVKD